MSRTAVGQQAYWRSRCPPVPFRARPSHDNPYSEAQFKTLKYVQVGAGSVAMSARSGTEVSVQRNGYGETDHPGIIDWETFQATRNASG
jgi:hypothetical protein